MPRLREAPKIIWRVGPYTFIKRLVRAINDDNLFTWAAALSYSWLFALFPFLLFFMSLFPFLPSQIPFTTIPFRPELEQVDSGIHQVLQGDIADQVFGLVKGFYDNAQGRLLSVSLIIAIFTASGGVSMTMSALDKCYDIQDVRPFWKQRLWAIALTIFLAGGVLTLLVLLPIGTAVLQYLESQAKSIVHHDSDQSALPNLDTIVDPTTFPTTASIFVDPSTQPTTVATAAKAITEDSGSFSLWIDVARYSLALTIMIMMVAVVYQFGPSLRRRFHLFSPGAVFTVLTWLALGLAFNYYITSMGAAANYQKTYGTVAGVAILMLLFYVDGLILMIGAEINSELDFAMLGITREGELPQEKVVDESELTEEDRELRKELEARHAEVERIEQELRTLETAEAAKNLKDKGSPELTQPVEPKAHDDPPPASTSTPAKHDD